MIHAGTTSTLSRKAHDVLVTDHGGLGTCCWALSTHPPLFLSLPFGFLVVRHDFTHNASRHKACVIAGFKRNAVSRMTDARVHHHHHHFCYCRQCRGRRVPHASCNDALGNGTDRDHAMESH
ncbi:hypothetical protein DQ04_07461040 [Trypanosoma grayi]|uniref:hypothetical protein n=1 Tax=Trypanosoma grayi TaxID=71804 RepID=UPI0004F49512|nr:hypothetical protein DQ04_07461040 [Trypanosoma grayi]KEG08320.1 hypothetical protein DQ04_07461040 [Trypanosoma grayi]